MKEIDKKGNDSCQDIKLFWWCKLREAIQTTLHIWSLLISTPTVQFPEMSRCSCVGGRGGNMRLVNRKQNHYSSCKDNQHGGHQLYKVHQPQQREERDHCHFLGNWGINDKTKLHDDVNYPPVSQIIEHKQKNLIWSNDTSFQRDEKMWCSWPIYEQADVASYKCCSFFVFFFFPLIKHVLFLIIDLWNKRTWSSWICKNNSST